MCSDFLQREGEAKQTPGAELGHGDKWRRAIRGLRRSPFRFSNVVHVRLLEGHRWHGVQTARSRGKRGWNPAIALLQTTSRPCAKQSHENGHDLCRLISRRILRMILRLTFIFAWLKKPDNRRAPLAGWGVERGLYAYSWLFFYHPLLTFIFWISS